MKRYLLSAVSFALAMSLTAGCPATESRTNNQGGGSILSAGAKFASGSLANLTPDEIQVVTDFVAGVVPRFEALDVDDTEAQAAVDFLEANDINTVADIQALAQNPGEIEIPDSVQVIIEATSLEQFKN